MSKQMKRGPKPNTEKTNGIISMYATGATMEVIAVEHGVTRQRIQQILKKHNAEGGASTRAFLRCSDVAKKSSDKAAKKEQRIFRQWGLTVDAYNLLVEQYGSAVNSQSPLHKYIRQRTNAKKRDIGWQMTFAQWWAMWQESGKWAERGRGHGYVMARHGDSGPYSVDNVYITTGAQNSADSYIVSPAAVRFAHVEKRKLGTGKGWSYLPNRSKKNPYIVTIQNKYVGSYATADEAHVAYLQAAEAIRAN